MMKFGSDRLNDVGVCRSVDRGGHRAAWVADALRELGNRQANSEELGLHPNAKIFAIACHAGYGAGRQLLTKCAFADQATKKVSMAEKISPSEVAELRTKSGLSQTEFANRLGVSRNYVSMLERGAKEVSRDSSIGLLLGILSRELEDGGQIERSVEPKAGGIREIAVTSWAHAGEATSYEELPRDWQDRVPTECQDEHAFAVRLEGESMEPRFSEGDLLILQPGKEAYSGCLAVCRFKSDGVVFRRVEFLSDKIRLIALNSRYQPSEHSRDEFTWIYPVWGRWTQIWK